MIALITVIRVRPVPRSEPVQPDSPGGFMGYLVKKFPFQIHCYI